MTTKSSPLLPGGAQQPAPPDSPACSSGVAASAPARAAGSFPSGPAAPSLTGSWHPGARSAGDLPPTRITVGSSVEYDWWIDEHGLYHAQHGEWVGIGGSLIEAELGLETLLDCAARGIRLDGFDRRFDMSNRERMDAAVMEALR